MKTGQNTLKTIMLLLALVVVVLAVSRRPEQSSTTEQTAAPGTRSEPVPVACPKTCAVPDAPKLTYTFDVDKFLANPNDPANDPEICLRVSTGDEVEWATTSKEIRINKVDAFGGHHGNPFKNGLPFVPPAGQKNIKSGPLANGSAPGANSNRCWLYKANLQVKNADGNWEDKDPHIFTSPGGLLQ